MAKAEEGSATPAIEEPVGEDCAGVALVGDEESGRTYPEIGLGGGAEAGLDGFTGWPKLVEHSLTGERDRGVAIGCGACARKRCGPVYDVAGQIFKLPRLSGGVSAGHDAPVAKGGAGAADCAVGCGLHADELEAEASADGIALGLWNGENQ